MIVGVTWYRPEEYKAVMAMCEDGGEFPDSFEEWLSNANHGLKKLQRLGYKYEKAILGPETFPAFCRQHNFKMDSEGRAAFAANHVRILDERAHLDRQRRPAA